MVIRFARAADAEAIERIRIRGWQRAYRHIFDSEELDRLEPNWSRFEHELERPPTGRSTFVAELGGLVVGFALVGPSRDEHGLGELYAIYVDPDSWSLGAGRSLIRRAEERLAEDYREAALWVLEENLRARSFYEHAGWHPDGARNVFERPGFSAPELRYRKLLRNARSWS
jgi:ribosomal protein S18 acetylase RimI-like enzyme